jgi:glyoxylase-like metal-dependent hydrolase (beta-lactamase superfamily II)
MKRTLTILAAGVSLFAGFAASAQTAPEMSLARFDCGTSQGPTVVNKLHSDTYTYDDLKIQFVFSCYLIKHGDEYLLWDTGLPPTAKAPNVAPKVSLVDYLSKIDVKPEQIKYVGISHYHGDHTGQISSFPKSTLLIGAREWDAISSPAPPEGVNVKPFESWIKGESKVEPQATDKDVFGDGSVIMLRMPGHTPGHSSLLVKLAQMGPVILSGDVVHFRENYDTDGVPTFNFDRAQTVASIERIKGIVKSQKATLIIQHDARDVEKLPVFPAFAK